MILHVFTADRVHLVPQMIKGFLRLDEQQFFLLGRTKEDCKDDVYKKIFRENKRDNYKITHSFRELMLFSKQFKKSEVVLHGVPYIWMIYYLLFGFKDVKWVCWGAGASINKSNWKSVLFTPLKRIIYRNFSKIGVLMQQDANNLQKDYGVKKVSVLSYFGSIDSFPFTEKDLLYNTKNKTFKSVYLGNNSSNINSYLRLTNILGKFKQYITINCMANYSFKESAISLKLRDVGMDVYGDRFKLDTTLYTLEEYYRYMNQCDIYICAATEQSGLGAIHTCLRLGKKVYLSGVNYDWIKSLGCTIFHVDEIENISDADFLKDISHKQKIENFRIIDNYLDKDIIIRKWYNFFL